MIAAARGIIQVRKSTLEPGAQRPDLVFRLEARIHCFSDDDPAALTASVARLRAIDQDLHLRSSAGRELLAALLHCTALTSKVPVSEICPVAREIVKAGSPELAYLLTPLLMASGVLAVAGDTALPSAWMSFAREEVS